MKKVLAAMAILSWGAGLQGQAISNDLFFVTNNMGRVTSVPNGEVILYPQLVVNPPRKTLVAGGVQTLSAQGATNPVTWFMIERPSGGTIAVTGPTSITYQAGATSDCVDIVETWDGGNMFGRAYMNVISPAEVAAAGKAVIVAGRKGADDPLWPATDYLANSAFNTLLYRGYGKEHLQYLNPVPGRDIDGNGTADDMDLESTFGNARLTFTNWVGNTHKLFVYLVDHGEAASTNGFFRLNAGETLPGTTLKGWLDNIQNTYTTEVTVVVDCCYAGTLINQLSYTGAAKRILIASSGTNEPAYFIGGGLVSFSDAFFGGIMLGYDVLRAYEQARGAMLTYQNPAYADNGSGGEGTNVWLGATFVAGKDIPQIGLVCGRQLLMDGTTANLWARDVVSSYPIERVWCMVVPPSHSPTNAADPVQDIPELTLVYTNDPGRYQQDYGGFSEEGTYKVIYYAKDIWGSVSLPRQSYVDQASYDERVILLAGYATNAADVTAIRSMANDAWRTLVERGFATNRLRYFSHEVAPPVSTSPSLSALSYAITNWAATTNWGGPADKLTVYIAGQGSNSQLRLNSGEWLAASQLDQWLDLFQASNRAVNVIMDFSGSGAWIPELVPPAERERINLASARAGAPCLREGGGALSFSRFFWRAVFQGGSIGMAFDQARRAVWMASGSWGQTAQLDDNGNGLPNEKARDWLMAWTRYIGPAFRTGNDAPVIGAVTPDTELTGTNRFMLWAQDVVDADGVSNVWCVITEPGYNGRTGVVETALAWNAGAQRYEADCGGFSVTGVYACTFYAEDRGGEISSPRQTLVRTRESSGTDADSYETDDLPEQAKPLFVGETQTRTLHVSNDVDWAVFFAGDQTNYYHTIRTDHLTNTVDTVLDIYREGEDGALTLIQHVDQWDPDQGESWGWYPSNGIYFVKVSSTNFTEPGGYELALTIDIGGPFDHLLVLAMNGLTAGAVPTGVKAHVAGFSDQAFNGAYSVDFVGPANGTHTVTLTGVPSGWYYVPGYPVAQNVTVPNTPGKAYYAQFVLLPCFDVTGTVRDAWTGEWLDGAALSFQATSGRIAGQTSASNWHSQIGGSLPVGVRVATVNWAVTLAKSGYSNTVRSLPGASMAAGSLTNWGTVWMVPVDTTGTGLPDAWRALYFTGAVDPQADADGDGQSNKEEYWANTHPTNGASLFMYYQAPSAVATGFTLTWPAASGRAYAVERAAALVPGDWVRVYGPQTSAAGQATMSWTDTNAVPGNCYRVVLYPLGSP